MTSVKAVHAAQGGQLSLEVFKKSLAEALREPSQTTGLIFEAAVGGTNIGKTLARVLNQCNWVKAQLSVL